MHFSAGYSWVGHFVQQIDKISTEFIETVATLSD